jgi:hypothetical protein
VALTGSGVIFAIVVIAWLCYLVPLTLRRHDEAVRSRSVDRFSSAMRVLGRADAIASPGRPAGRRRVTVPVGATAAPAAVRAPQPSAAARTSAQQAARKAAREAAGRRRRVLLVLLVLTAAVAGAAGTGRAPWWSVAVPVALVVAFLVLARWQVSRSRTAAWERTLRTSATRTVVPVGDEPDEAPTQVLRAVTDAPPARRPAAPQPGPAPAPAAPPGEERPAVAAPDPGAVGSSLWDPLPVTLPTYVSKPRAERSIRTVDLTAPGTRSAASSAGSSAASTAAASEHSAPDSGALRAAAPRAVGD